MAPKLTPRQLARVLRRAGPAIEREVGAEVQASALESEAAAKLNATRLLRVRTGLLRNSIQGRAVQVATGATGWELQLRAGNDREVRYARIQELGGVVRPRTARYLAIPQDPGPALTGAGVSRYESPRQVPGLSVAVSRSGKLRLVDEDGRTWYHLVKQVRIRRKLYLRRAFDAVERKMPQRLADAVMKSLTP